MLGRASEQRVSRTRTDTFPAPTKGWVQSGNLVAAGADQAEVLDNFIVTAQGARLRGGKSSLGDLGAAVIRLFTFQSGANEVMFGSTATAIFDVADIAGGAVKSSTTSGDWATTQISTAGGQFLVGVNGADTGFSYTGSTFTDLSITNVAPSDLSQLWLFKERLFFVEGGTQSAWYLPVESIGGSALELDMGSVFRRGGNLLFGATWSLDSGSGLDDVCLFFSDVGEIAVYEGTDPSSASTWALVGVYDIGKPVNKHGWFKAGGDLAVLTQDGIIPVSAALRKDRAALQVDAISYPIEDAWKSAILNGDPAFPVSATLWQSGTLLLVGTPANKGGSPISFAANARTGGWSRITGWDVQCSAVFEDRLYFGSANGNVYLADATGTDDGAQFTGVYVPKFKYADSLNSVNSVGLTYKAPQVLEFDLLAFADYNVAEITPTATASLADYDVWGTGVWGSFIWGSSAEVNTYTTWQSAYANGYATSLGVVITSNQTVPMPFEIVVSRLRSETGYAL